ncbi:MAG: UbiA family prenyltransferase [Williamsia sp.]|nr:UbiA family prenyltransferase [Williamsia sp.]
MLKKLFHFFIFSSLYIAGCAVLMVYQTDRLLHLRYDYLPCYLFVFFSTICSYNFHWYFTPDTPAEEIRIRWTQRHKGLHVVFYIVGLIGAGVYAWHFIGHWFWLGVAVVLTFLYSAPKIPFYPFTLLRKIAVGKTIFLAAVWTYVTAFLPAIFSNRPWTLAATLFCLNRFFFIYAICIVFDYRDRISDKQEGIRSMITLFSEKGIDRLFWISMGLFAVTTLALYYTGFSLPVLTALLVPGIILAFLYNYTKHKTSDYLYYFVLDGLMMASALFGLFIPIGYI